MQRLGQLPFDPVMEEMRSTLGHAPAFGPIAAPLQQALQEPGADRYLEGMDTLAPPTTGFSVSPRAAARIAEIVSAQPGSTGPASQALRVSVLAGGCSGLQYEFKLVPPEPAADDRAIQAGESLVLVDGVSLDFLGGAELDFSDALMGAHFAIRNPNATSSCGCGTSFSVD